MLGQMLAMNTPGGSASGASPGSAIGEGLVAFKNLAIQHYCTAFVGGAAGALDAINTSAITEGDQAIVMKNGVWIFQAKDAYALAECATFGGRGYKSVTPDTDGGSKPNLRWVLMYAIDPAGEREYFLGSYYDNNNARCLWLYRGFGADTTNWYYELAHISVAAYALASVLRTSALDITLRINNLTLAGTGKLAGIIAGTSATDAMNYGQRSATNLPITFSYENIAASLTDQVMLRASGKTAFWPAPCAGSLTINHVALSAPRVAGTIVFEPTIEGTKVTSAALDLTINSATDLAYASVSPKTTNLIVTQGKKVGMVFTTDGSWDPTTADADVELTFTPD